MTVPTPTTPSIPTPATMFDTLAGWTPDTPAPNTTATLTRFTVHGSHGDLIVDSATGDVIEYNLPRDEDGTESDDYRAITRFDVPELLRWQAVHFPTDRLTQGMDILSIGYWSVDGSYEPAEPDYRREAEGFAAERATWPARG